MKAACIGHMELRNLAFHTQGQGQRMRRRPMIVMFLTLALLASCAHQASESSGRIVRISPDLTLTLPRPGDLSQSLEASQLVTARYGAQSFAFEGHISATPERFLMIGLDSLGRRTMTITWTESAITYEAASWLPAQLRPENILADMVLLYWPELSVRSALAPSGGAVTVSPGRRIISRNDQPVVVIEYEAGDDGSSWSGRLRYRNLAFNYEMDVQSIRANP